MVIKKKNEGNWEYCIYLGQDENGKKKYKRKSGFKTRKACIEEASNLIDNVVIKNTKDKTFRDLAFIYLDDCKNSNLRQGTLNCYTCIVKSILKKFKYSDKYMHYIKPKHLTDFVYDLNNYDLSSERRQDIVMVFKSIFKNAKDKNLISKNFEINLPKIKVQPKKRFIWHDSELKQYLPILKNFIYFDIVLLALESGMRRGEILGLTWDSINFDKGTLFVNKTYVRTTNFLGFMPPKTNAGIREIILLDDSLKMLEKRFKNRLSDKYVFTNTRNTSKPLCPLLLSSSFKKFLLNNNMRPIHFHDLRHIHATFLLQNNIDYKTLSKRLGHTNISFTLDTYTHVIPDKELKLFKNLPKICAK